MAKQGEWIDSNSINRRILFQSNSSLNLFPYLVLLGLVISPATLLAQNNSRQTTDDTAQGPEDQNTEKRTGDRPVDRRLFNERHPLDLDQLPAPPADFAELIRHGNVTFEVGGSATAKPTRPSSQDRELSAEPNEQQGDDSLQDSPDRRRFSRRRFSQRRPITRFDGETNFQVRVDYKSKARWRIRKRKEGRQLRITVHFQDVVLNTSHVVWLRRVRTMSRFWDSPLVQHEFDHVRISTDSRFESRLEEDLRANHFIERTIDDDFEVTPKSVQVLIDEHVTNRFNQITELIEIRYQELDQQTNHGTRPLPQDSDLAPLLRPEMPDSDKSPAN